MKRSILDLQNSVHLELKPYYRERPLEVIDMLTSVIQKILREVGNFDPNLDNSVASIGLDKTLSAFQKGLHRAEDMCLRR